MKSLFLALALTFTAQASADCLGEAQLHVTTVRSIQKHATGCRVFPSQLVLDANPHCVLDDTLVIMDGIEVGMKGLDCAYKVGQEISGVLVYNGEFVELNPQSMNR